ncbi:hypothetical protein MKZ07_10150 [Paenibacillus sp. FSL P4-0338]|uniref:hypothetical protein n=1 Tax=unclassified Paenibacillus TaxID=185978 RepID=UPI0003E29ACC|nr:hypothetical protein [Paenibacillus sp. FSL R7-269]ETT33940.1 hypothetical protein C162_30375 [Paenibacillus sp. FSL R7-269]
MVEEKKIIMEDSVSQWENTKKERMVMLEQLKAELNTLQQQLSDLDAQIKALQKNIPFGEY